MVLVSGCMIIHKTNCRYPNGAGSSHQHVVGCHSDEDNEGRSDMWQILDDAAAEVIVNNTDVIVNSIFVFFNSNCLHLLDMVSLYSGSI